MATLRMNVMLLVCEKQWDQPQSMLLDFIMAPMRTFYLLFLVGLLASCNDNGDTADAIVSQCFSSKNFFETERVSPNDFAAIADIEIGKNGQMIDRNIQIRSPLCGLLTIKATLPENFDEQISAFNFDKRENFFCRGDACGFNSKSVVLGIRGTGKVIRSENDVEVHFQEVLSVNEFKDKMTQSDMEAFRRLFVRDMKVINPAYQ